jgi:ABC-2 type transport system permease protein
VTGVGRYLRLWLALARLALIREMMFRTNYLVKVGVEIFWFVVLLIYYDVLLTQTGRGTIAGWTRPEFLFFVGCYITLEGFLETFFLGSCGGFADLVRSGDLDNVLLKPIDGQFLVSLCGPDWTTAPNILMGVGVMVYALVLQQWEFNAGQLALFAVLFGCGLGLAYSFLILLTSTAVWTVRNQSLYELWWLFTTLWRYPREIFEQSWAAFWVSRFFTYCLPIMLIVNVPVSVIVRRVFDPYLTVYIVAATVLMLWGTRQVFRFALRKYRSASS